MMMKPLIAVCGMLSAASSLAHAALPAVRLAVLKEDFQVLQRDSDDKVTCLVALSSEVLESSLCEWTLSDGSRVLQTRRVQPEQVPGLGLAVRLQAIPLGGPYTVTVTTKVPRSDHKIVFQNVLVGDIWVLGGQSNMFGIDRIRETLPALPYVNLLDLRHLSRDAHWCAGLPPIHRIPEPFATFTIRAQHPEWSDEQIKRTLSSGVPIGGIDCSYFFAHNLYAESGVPIGLIPCAIGSALAYWDPAHGDENRYGFMLHHVQSAGGRVKGLLFFQGEQDAIFGEEHRTVTSPSLIYPTGTYARQFQSFVEAFRRDCGTGGSPVLFAQICRHHNGRKEKATGWEIIREAQRRIPDVLPHSHCVPTVDLDVMDGLHLDYDSLKRVGHRMAFLALPYVKKGVAPRSEIKLESVRVGKSVKPTIVLEFTGVTGKLHAPGRGIGFSLKDKATGEVLDWIYKVEFDSTRPNTVVLHVVREPNRPVALYYAAGAAPYVNITDENDMPLPAFGPAELKY
jgi:sialate O-acetylesterase